MPAMGELGSRRITLVTTLRPFSSVAGDGGLKGQAWMTTEAVPPGWGFTARVASKPRLTVRRMAASPGGSTPSQPTAASKSEIPAAIASSPNGIPRAIDERLRWSLARCPSSSMATPRLALKASKTASPSMKPRSYVDRCAPSEGSSRPLSQTWVAAGWVTRSRLPKAGAGAQPRGKQGAP